MMEMPRLFPPGEGWAYHGSNYIVLRLLVEEATGRRCATPSGSASLDRWPDANRSGRRSSPRDCARGYLPADNPVLPGGPGPVDVTEIDVPFHGAGGGVVSTAGEIASDAPRLARRRVPSRSLRAEMLRGGHLRWLETDRYGLGIGEITALMGRRRSPCGPAWGHIGFSVGYTAMALSSEDGQSGKCVICANGTPSAPFEAFWDAAGRLAWHLALRVNEVSHRRGAHSLNAGPADVP